MLLILECEDFLTHSADLQMREIRENVQENFVGELLDGLEWKRSSQLDFLNEFLVKKKFSKTYSAREP